MFRHSFVAYAVFLAGFALVAGDYFTWQLTDVLLDEDRRKNLQKVLHRPKLVGVVERTLFVVTIVARQAAFIVAWLALKAIGAGTWGRAGGDERPGDRDLYQRFLIGSGVSVLFAIAVAKSIEWTAPAKGEPKHWEWAIGSCAGVVALSTLLILWWLRLDDAALDALRARGRVGACWARVARPRGLRI
jgi:hypothetical protein